MSSKCSHVKVVADILKSDDKKSDFVYVFLATRFDSNVCGKAPWFLRSKSYMPIPFELPERLSKIMFERSECHVQVSGDVVRMIPDIPNSNCVNEKCRLCGSPVDQE